MRGDIKREGERNDNVIPLTSFSISFMKYSCPGVHAVSPLLM